MGIVRCLPHRHQNLLLGSSVPGPFVLQLCSVSARFSWCLASVLLLCRFFLNPLNLVMFFSDSYIVRVKAVVMTRDESSGGWLALDGCLSRVGVCRLLHSELQGRNSFLIHGERLTDRQVGSTHRYRSHRNTVGSVLVILECFLKKDLVYTKATPTFHHWKVDNRKCGLTFQCSSDARAFDRGVRRALEDLAEGMKGMSGLGTSGSKLWSLQFYVVLLAPSGNSYPCQHYTPCSFLHGGHQPSSATRTFQIKVLVSQIRSLFTSSRKEPQAAGLSFPSCLQDWSLLRELEEVRLFPEKGFLDRARLEAMHIFPRHANFPLEEEEIVRISPRGRTWLTGYEDYRHANSTRDKLTQPHNPDTCMHFTKSEPPKHDYTYPYPLSCGVQRGYDSKPGCLEMGSGRRAVVTLQPRPPQSKAKSRMEDGERFRCVYCQDMFNREDNGRGQCQEAPDPIQTCIRRVSFMWCADSLLYHCMSDPEGDYSDPCSCDTSDERFCLRWTALISLSLVAPCMCCYAPLRACHRCGVACHCCGGKHRAVG
ncbi:hypothetical protein GOODEAATRI_018624 [Goodea atripinnis]|uniref:Sprouty-related, EVH1 domain-containing protein 2 n=1 Tax=Goodea atripinnis TaxID=208336 RepID=A0ABV0PFG4_9TELE